MGGSAGFRRSYTPWSGRTLSTKLSTPTMPTSSVWSWRYLRMRGCFVGLHTLARRGSRSRPSCGRATASWRCRGLFFVLLHWRRRNRLSGARPQALAERRMRGAGRDQRLEHPSDDYSDVPSSTWLFDYPSLTVDADTDDEQQARLHRALALPMAGARRIPPNPGRQAHVCLGAARRLDAPAPSGGAQGEPVSSYNHRIEGEPTGRLRRFPGETGSTKRRAAEA